MTWTKSDSRTVWGIRNTLTNKLITVDLIAGGIIPAEGGGEPLSTSLWSAPVPALWPLRQEAQRALSMLMKRGHTGLALTRVLMVLHTDLGT